MNKKEIIETINSLIISCESGKTEDWDFYNEDNWTCMINDLKLIKEYIK